MSRKTFIVSAVFAVFATSFACAARRTEDRADQGSHGPSSPAESGQHGPDAYNAPPFGRDKTAMAREHETAGLNGEMHNGKVDVTMEGSGNLAWQGSYEREKRARAQQETTTGKRQETETAKH